MCGICGELRFDGEPAELAVIQRMSVRLVRRGPDHAGRFSDGPLAFGHRRLAIIDLSEQANQPMFDPQLGLVLVFDGAIYQLSGAARDADRQGLLLLLYWRYGGDPQGVARLGRGQC